MKKYRYLLWLLLLCLTLSACTGTPVREHSQMPEEMQNVTSKEKLKVHIIDVGQGDSTFVELPSGDTLLIDAGEREYGERVISYIESLGYQKVDYLVATHPHSDHIGGLQAVIESFDIGKVFMPKKSSTTSTFKKLLEAVKNKGLGIETAKAGKVIATDTDLSITILSPVEEDYKDEMNLYSAVVKITYGKMRFLFMGDAETENEEQMQDVSAEFIRVGHHGSRTSSGEEFVRRVGAQIAVVSVGKDNSYELPKEEILSRWQKAGATIYRTDKSGSLVFESDGESIIAGDAVYTETEPKESPSTTKWMLNTASKKIHYPDCSAALTIKAQNKSESDKSIAELEAEGYTVCGTCDPVEG